MSNGMSSGGGSRGNTIGGDRNNNMNMANNGLVQAKSRERVIRPSNQQPDWKRIQDRIRDYSSNLPYPDEEGVLHLYQGSDFDFCDEFVNTIRYGQEFYAGMIVQNFVPGMDSFFVDLIKVF